ncbi:MAG: hypothetical protein ACOYN0_13625 [Phycisphaerales bacterium]
MKRVAIVLFSALLMLAGCSSFEPADSARAMSESAPVPVVWPERDTKVLQEYADKTPSAIFGLKWRPDADRAKAKPIEVFQAGTPAYMVSHVGVHGLALVRVYQDNRENSHPKEWGRIRARSLTDMGFIPNCSVVTSRGLTLPIAKLGARSMSQKMELDNAVRESKRQATVYDDAILRCMFEFGTRVRIPEPSKEPVRGLIFHFHALESNPGELAARKHMAEQGWAVVEFQTDPHVVAPLKKQNAKLVEELKGKMTWNWQFAVHGVEIQLTNGDKDFIKSGDPGSQRRDWVRTSEKLNDALQLEFELNASTDTDVLGKDIARQVDEVIASNAYGAEAVYRYLKANRPDLLQGPFVLMGYSAGSLATPAAAMRLMQMEEPVIPDAVVLVGSGADLFMLSQESTLTDGGITLKDGKKKPAKELVERVHRSYREHVNLDPLITATALRSVPVLQVHASRDHWVPSKGGEELWEQLGRPDRLTISGGHVRLFWTLGWYMDQISEWVDRNAPAR